MLKLGYITGKRIKTERINLNNISQEKLGEKIGEKTGQSIKRQTISSWEKGESFPDLKNLVAMSQIFSCDIAYLLGDIEERHVMNAKITTECGLSEQAADNLITAHQNKNPYINILSALLEDEAFLSHISSCITADYGHISTFIEIPDPFTPKGTHPTLISPADIRKCDIMQLYNALCKFINKQRQEMGLSAFDEL